MNAIALDTPVIHFKVQLLQACIWFMLEAPKNGAQRIKSVVIICMITHTALHSVRQKALNQANCLQEIAMLNGIVDPRKTSLEQLIAGNCNFRLV